MSGFHIAVVSDTAAPDDPGSGQPAWLRVAPSPGSAFGALPGFGMYGRALLANDLVAENPGAVVLLADTTTVPESQLRRCLRVLAQGEATGRALSWAEEFDRLRETEVIPAGLVAIRRRDWDQLGGLSEYLPFGFIGDLERRARRSTRPLAKAAGRLGDEASADDDLAYGVTLLGCCDGTRAGRLAASRVVRRLVRSGQLSHSGAAKAVRSARASARDVRHLGRQQREREDR